MQCELTYQNIFRVNDRKLLGVCLVWFNHRAKQAYVLFKVSKFECLLTLKDANDL